MTIKTKYTQVEEKDVKSNKVNCIKSSLIYEDGEGTRRKGYYIYTVPCYISSECCIILSQVTGVEKLIINLKDKRNSKTVKEDAEIMFETESDNLEKYLISTLSLIKK